MRCEKCTDIIKENEVYHFRGKVLCDDCYIDLVMGVAEPDFTRFSPELQSKFRNIRKGWNRNRPIYRQIRF